MHHNARKTVGNGERHDTQVVPYGAVLKIYITKRERHIGRSLHLCGGVQHIFDENAISGSWIVDENVGHSADELAVLDDGGATRPLPVAEEGRGASGSGLCATQPRRRQGAHREPQQESRTC